MWGWQLGHRSSQEDYNRDKHLEESRRGDGRQMEKYAHLVCFPVIHVWL